VCPVSLCTSVSSIRFDRSAADSHAIRTGHPVKLDRIRVISRSIHEQLVDVAKFAAEGLEGHYGPCCWGREYASQLLSTTMAVTMIITTYSSAQISGYLSAHREISWRPDLSWPFSSDTRVFFVPFPLRLRYVSRSSENVMA
jgi:hypothetical protein